MLPIRMRFQVSIASALLVIISALTLATLVSVYLASSKAAEETAENLFHGVARNAQERLDRMVGATLMVAGLGASQPNPGVPTETGLTSSVLPLLFTALAEEPAIYSVYYGFDNGDFLQVIASRNDGRIIAAHNAPPTTEWIVRAITGSGPARKQIWSFLNQERRQIGRQVDPTPDYDPRLRPWYDTAKNRSDAQLSSAYVFNSLKQPGITASKRLPNQKGVFGVDITLSGLDQFVSEQAMSPHGGVVLFDQALRVLAVSRNLREADQPPLADMRKLRSPQVKAVIGAVDGGRQGLNQMPADDGILLVNVQDWHGGGQVIRLAAVAPEKDFTGAIREMQKQILLLALAGMVLFLPSALYFSSRMARNVVKLAEEAERIRRFDFGGEVPPRSNILEFEHLGVAFGLMKDTLREKTSALEVAQEKLARLVELGIAMSAERDSNMLFEMILLGAKDLTNADGGTLYIVDDNKQLQFQILRNDTLNEAAGGTAGKPIRIPPVPLFGTDGLPNHSNVVSHAVHQQTTINIPDAYNATDFDFSGTKAFDARTGYRSSSFLTVPLKPRGGEVIGALQLINARLPGTSQVVPFAPDIQRFVEALSAQAATALYNRELLNAQERLMDSMIELIAGAIDAKSPYTGGHCERVPELAMMLAREATAVTEGPLAEFGFSSEEEWREFRVGAWLHDCGKVVTPEHVVDKATKLETIYNRIHEVRTRFEVLLRDAEIERLTAIANGQDVTTADANRDQRRTQLMDDFAFVAECNLGGEFMAPERIERLRKIGAQVWMRHFDDRLGLAHDELERYSSEPVQLPVQEALLADKPHHVLPRARALNRAYDGLGFKLKTPEHLYDLGEVHNLTISRGTLTEEDRFKINEHIMQTIAMLERLPFPKNLRRVPEYAGTHHETLVGTGYPRKLGESDLSVPSRIMAIADIFEALTASDRPYKKAKTLSESIRILSMFVKDGHIDRDLFELFLRSGVYREYAQRYLLPDQIDVVDLNAYLARPAVPAA